MEKKDKSNSIGRFGHAPIGDDAEIQLKAEMRDWSNDKLIAQTLKNSGNARGIAAQQLLDSRREAKAAERHKSTFIIGLSTLIIAVLTWLVPTLQGWMALLS